VRRRPQALIALLVGVAGWLLMSSDIDAQKTRPRCGVGHRIRILDLDISPDPIGPGQKIEKFRAVAQLDGISECDTLFELREDRSDDVVAYGMRKALRPGKNQIDFRPIGEYHFRSHEQCFEINAEIAGTRRPVDAARRFCVREIPRQGRRWSMR
jgi:hypothetical protein